MLLLLACINDSLWEVQTDVGYMFKLIYIKPTSLVPAEVKLFIFFK